MFDMFPIPHHGIHRREKSEFNANLSMFFYSPFSFSSIHAGSRLFSNRQLISQRLTNVTQYHMKINSSVMIRHEGRIPGYIIPGGKVME
jgi:hypothetical protein